MRYGVDDGEDWSQPKDERRAKLRNLVQEGSTFHYAYDFGDCWRHRIVVEKVLPAEAGTRYPACTGSRRACPPEDCGRPWGYQDFLVPIADLYHEEHESMLTWVGGSFGPGAFNAGEFEHRLQLVRLVAL